MPSVTHTRSRPRAPESHGPIEHGRQQRASDGEIERDREHGHVRPRGKSRARAGQESPIPVSPAIATLAGRIAASTKLCTATAGWQFRAAPRSRTGPTATLSPRRSHRQRPRAGRPKQRWPPPLGQPPPEPSCRWRPVPSPDRPRAGCPLLHKAHPAQAGKNDHIHLRQHGDNGDGGRLDVAIGLLESDNDNRQQRYCSVRWKTIAQITHEYLAPCRSHAHCQSVHAARLNVRSR